MASGGDTEAIGSANMKIKQTLHARKHCPELGSEASLSPCRLSPTLEHCLIELKHHQLRHTSEGWGPLRRSKLHRPRGCQPALDLGPSQVDLRRRLVALNPKGRKQTKKYRPVVPISETLQPWVSTSASSHFVMFSGCSVGDIKKSFARAAERPS